MTISDLYNSIIARVSQVGGRVYEYVAGNVRRAREFLGAKWRVMIQNREELRKAREVDVILRIRRLEDKTLRNLLRRQDIILGRVNSILARLGVGWRVRKQRGRRFSYPVFSRNEIRFTLYKIGTLPIPKAIIIIGGIFALYGIFITGVKVVRIGKTIFEASGPELTTQDIRELSQILPEEDRQRIIEKYVEAAAPGPGPLEQLKGTLETAIILAVVGFGIYAVVKSGILEKK
ncbi:MAG: hypothetical protein DDT22_01322 [candidate division WS2 bacterium]|nr:hypothetical protein [Candidatus Lithacetigena glycinireducens]